MKYGMSGILQRVRLGKQEKVQLFDPPSCPCSFFEIRKKIVRLGVTLEVLGDKKTD